MSEVDPTQKSRPSTIDDEMEAWPESPYIRAAVAEAHGRAAEVQVPSAPMPRPRRAAPLLLLLVVGLLLTAGLALWWYVSRRPEAPVVSGGGSPSPTPTPVLSFNPKEATVKVGEPNNRDGYRVTTGVISSGGSNILKFVKYEFFSDYFLFNNTSLKNEPRMKAILRERKPELDDSWVIIFATASMEGHADYNTELCRNRIYRVRDMMAQEVNVSAKSYWGILAGEFKMPLPGIRPEREEEEEDELAKKSGEEVLWRQRKLIVISIKELQPLAPAVQQRVPLDVALSISATDVLPKTYDAPESEPFPLSPGGK
jgi:hypothetical protein